MPQPPQNTNPYHKSQTHDRSVRVERKITNPRHNPPTHDPGQRMSTFSATQEALIHDKILESFDKFVSSSSEEGFEMVMGGKERVVKRFVGK